jgi:hypothetical protein
MGNCEDLSFRSHELIDCEFFNQVSRKPKFGFTRLYDHTMIQLREGTSFRTGAIQDFQNTQPVFQDF